MSSAASAAITQVPRIDLLLFDVGNVLGTNGWDHIQRAAAAELFGLDFASFEERHQEAVDTWECGRMTLSEYLDFTVFAEPRGFTRTEFENFMFAQSVRDDTALQFVAALKATNRYVLMSTSNESRELYEYRAELFGLRPLFSVFLASCFIGVRKPDALFYDRVLSIAHADPARTVLIDDREENLAPARARGVHTVHAQGIESIRTGLAALGVTSTAS